MKMENESSFTTSGAAAAAASSSPNNPTSSAHLPTGGSRPPAGSQQPPVNDGASVSRVSVNVAGDLNDSSDVGNFANEISEVTGLIMELRDHNRRAHALSELAQRNEMYHQIAPLIWFSFGTVAILVQEVLAVYPSLSPPPLLTFESSRRACNALALFQCVASHPALRRLFAQAWIPYFLYTFIQATSSARLHQHLRLSALGVMGALVNSRDDAVVRFLLSSEIMPLCLHSMLIGCELSRTVSVFVFERLLMDELGLSYMCLVPERLLAANHALANVVHSLTQQPSARLLKLVIKCYIRLTMNERGRRMVKLLLPRPLTDGTFDEYLVGAPREQLMCQHLINIVNFPG